MFVRSTQLNLFLSALFVIGAGACSTGSGCCSFAPLPGGKLPADQTVEGGGQVRVTKSGFDKITSILPGYINQATAAGFCVGKGSYSALDYCYQQDNICDTAHGYPNGGCHVSVGLNPGGFVVSVPNTSTFHIHIDAHGDTNVPVDYFFGSCTMHVVVDNLIADADIRFGTDPTTGALTVHLDTINDFRFENHHFTGCGAFSGIASFFADFMNSFIGQWVIQQLTPTIDNLVQGFLPNPLGVEGMVDVGALLSGISPGTKALLEARVIPGGYVELKNNGLSLGIITGINSDEDVATRTPDLDSEPNRCVPPIPAPNFGAPPANLPITSRQTFALLAADQLAGSPDPMGTDIAMGISETTLDLAGHHAVTSGLMCLGVGTELVPQLTVGTIGILVPSLSDVGSADGKDPLLLVTRPQQAIDFSVGENTDTSPAISIKLQHVEVDIYAFIYERYVRALTLDLSMTIGVNLTFEQAQGMPVMIKPTLLGISSQNVTVKVLNSEFVKETPAELEQVLPAVFDLVASQLGAVPSIAVPSFAGFSLNNLSIQHVTTSQDDFVALFAGLGPSAKMRTLAATEPLMAAAVANMDAQIRPQQPASDATPRFVSVVTPPAEAIRGALRKSATGKLPAITFDVPTRDSRGRELEWAYNLDGGMWHQYASASPLVISDRALALQGKYTVGIKSRVVGDYSTVSEVTETKVIVDSVVPRVLVAKAAWDGDSFEVPLYDIVSEHDLEYGFAAPGADAPVAWHQGGKAMISRGDAEGLAINGEVALFAKDEAGNVSQVLIAAFHGQPGQAGCSCDSTGGPGAGGVLLFVLVGGVLVFGRGRRHRGLLGALARGARSRVVVTGALWLGASVAVSLQPGCSCSKASETVCEVNDDCDGFCPFGQEGLCMNNQCSCELTAGRTGPYSDVAVAPDGSVWVSAYSATFGDLVVAHAADAGRIPDEAWEWVDGVPMIEPSIPDSKIRGGITEPGPDVGMYTSIAIAPDGTPMVSYFDRDANSLMFAMKVGDVWQKHAVDLGGTADTVITHSGLYTSLTLRTDDGRPGIAYLAQIADSAGEHAEVRFAAAQSAHPASAADWQTWIVDSAPLPPVDPANMDIYPLPGGLGLFIDSARLPNQAPVIVYYDRANGELKMAKLNAQSGEFDAPVVLDGSTGDAGWSPSVAVDSAGMVRVAYVSATNDDFKYITDAPGAKPEVIDDGYRIVGQSPDGLPKPEFHFVGDDAGLVMPSGASEPLVVYQDATTQELLLAQRKADGSWSHVSIAGHTDPWPGAYGFFAADVIHGNNIVISTWVIDQPTDDNWVEIFTRPTIVE